MRLRSVSPVKIELDPASLTLSSARPSAKLLKSFAVLPTPKSPSTSWSSLNFSTRYKGTRPHNVLITRAKICCPGETFHCFGSQVTAWLMYSTSLISLHKESMRHVDQELHG